MGTALDGERRDPGTPSVIGAGEASTAARVEVLPLVGSIEQYRGGQRGQLTIVHVTAPTSVGGLERVVEGLAVGHHRRGHRVVVATLCFDPDGRPSRLAKDVECRGVAVHQVQLRPRGYGRERREIVRLCRDIQPDVVHTHGFRTDVVDRGPVARLGIPTVTTVHGRDMSGGLKGSFYEWLQRRAHRRFDAVVAVSAALRDETVESGVPPQRVHYIPNAWAELRRPLSREDARERLGLADHETVVGWVGRLIPVKGGDIFLEALRQLPQPRPTAVMIGYGPEADRLQHQARRTGIADKVRFVPNIDDAGLLFKAFETFVLSSRSEGLPIVALEAMAAEVPIVATRVGGLPQLLGTGEGWLVPPQDACSLAQAMRSSLENRVEAYERARLARRKLHKEFAVGPWLDRYERVYRSVARGP